MKIYFRLYSGPGRFALVMLTYLKRYVSVQKFMLSRFVSRGAKKQNLGRNEMWPGTPVFVKLSRLFNWKLFENFTTVCRCHALFTIIHLVNHFAGSVHYSWCVSVFEKLFSFTDWAESCHWWGLYFIVSNIMGNLMYFLKRKEKNVMGMAWGELCPMWQLAGNSQWKCATTLNSFINKQSERVSFDSITFAVSAY